MINRREMLGAMAGLIGAATIPTLQSKSTREEDILELFRKMQPRMIAILEAGITREFFSKAYQDVA